MSLSSNNYMKSMTYSFTEHGGQAAGDRPSPQLLLHTGTGYDGRFLQCGPDERQQGWNGEAEFTLHGLGDDMVGFSDKFIRGLPEERIRDYAQQDPR